jgi:hypothetical protein
MVGFGPLFQFKVGGSSYAGLIPIQPLLRVNFPAPAALAASVVLLFVCLRTRAGRRRGFEVHGEQCSREVQTEH